MSRMMGLISLAPATTPASARAMGPEAVHVLPAIPPTATGHYGPAARQIGELRLPAGKGPFPVAVAIHGGCWTSGFETLRGTAPIAFALAARGIATWNIEYRQVGDAGGGWPGSFRDWAAGTGHLRALAKRYPLDLPQTLVASAVFTPPPAEAYRQAAVAKGDRVTVVTTPDGDHFNIIAPGEPQWRDVEAAIVAAVPKR